MTFITKYIAKGKLNALWFAKAQGEVFCQRPPMREGSETKLKQTETKGCIVLCENLGRTITKYQIKQKQSMTYSF